MRHHLYRHVEDELFVPASDLADAVTYLEWVLRCCGGDRRPPPRNTVARDFGWTFPKASNRFEASTCMTTPSHFAASCATTR